MTTPVAAPSFESEALPHLDTLYRVALRLTGESAAADDLVQETMLRAWRNWNSFRSGSNARAWLVTILRNEFINGWRRNRRRPAGIDIEALPEIGDADNPDPEGRFFSSLMDHEVTEALDALPDDFRDVVVLSDLEELPYAEVSEVLGIPVGTVKSRLFRARRILQDRLRRYAVESGIVSGKEKGE